MSDDDLLWKKNAEDHARLDSRISSMQNRAWWLVGLMLPVLGMAIVIWSDTQSLKKSENLHATKSEFNEMHKVDNQQTKALNWQTKAIDAIAKRLDVSNDLPERPLMIEER